MKDFYIRKVTPGDEEVLAFIQTESWKAAFKSIVRNDLLEKCTNINRSTEMYHALINNNTGNGYILEVDGQPHCIAWWDAARDSDMHGYAELICIHSLPDKWRCGYGSKMTDKILEDIHNAGYKKVMLWVFTENHRARNFYEAKGFFSSGIEKPALGTTEIMYTYEFCLK